MANPIFYLFIASCNTGLLIWDISKHDYTFGIFQAVIGVIMFGLYIQSVIESNFSPPKPKRTEHIYD